MLRPELYNDMINLILCNAEVGKLCSEIQLQKMAKALTSWRNSDLSDQSSESRLVWKYLRSTSLTDVLKEAGVSYKIFKKRYGDLRRNQGERSYWSFEDEYGVSLLVKFSNYLSGGESLASAGLRLGWSRQAVYQLMVQIFGEKFSFFVKKVKAVSSVKLKKQSKDERLQLQILKAGAALGDTKSVESLLNYGKGDIRFIQRPEALFFKSLTGKFKLLKGQKAAKGPIVIDTSKIPNSADFVVVCVNGRFYKHDDRSSPIVLSQSRIKFSQSLSF